MQKNYLKKFIDKAIYCHNEDSKKILLEAFDNVEKGLSVNEYVQNNYLKIMQEWQKNTGNFFDIPNGHITISVNNERKIINVGNKSNDSLYDVASITKLYTEVILFLMLKEKKYPFTIDMPLSKIALINNKMASSLYPSLPSSMTILDLLSFNNEYLTDSEGIIKAHNKKDGLKIARSVYIDKKMEGRYFYRDFPLIIVTDLLENISGLSYEELLNKYILDKLKLHDTFYMHVPKNRIDDYTGLNKNGVNDPKANILDGGGHAGIITSPLDLSIFLDNLFNLLGEDIKYFTSMSKTIDHNGNANNDLAMIGNCNIATEEGNNQLARIILSKKGFYVQGSTRSDADICEYLINNEKYQTSSSILIDINNQLDQMINFILSFIKNKKYEVNNSKEFIIKMYQNMPDDPFSLIAKDFIKNTYVEDAGYFLCLDFRKLLSYKKGECFYKLSNMVGTAKIMLLYEQLLKEYKVSMDENTNNYTRKRMLK